MTDLKQWAAVENGVVVHGGFDAPQSYVDTYVEQVVDREDRATPPWWHPGVEFVDVTGVDPRPTTGWYKASNGRWVNGNPLLTVSRDTIPADGTTAATVTFAQKGPAAPTSVVFTVNGSGTTVDVVSGVAAIDVVSSTSGDVVTVTVGGLQVTVAVL